MDINTTAGPKNPQTLTKPLKETWTIEGSNCDNGPDVYESTEALVQTDKPIHGKHATYHFTTRTAEENSDFKSRATEAAIKGAMYSVIGVAVTLPFLMVANAFTPGKADAVAFCAVAAGMVTGAFEAFTEEARPTEGSVPGILQKHGDKVEFHSDRELDSKANLNDYKSAETPPLVDGKRSYGSQWWN